MDNSSTHAILPHEYTVLGWLQMTNSGSKRSTASTSTPSVVVWHLSVRAQYPDGSRNHALVSAVVGLKATSMRTRICPCHPLDATLPKLAAARVDLHQPFRTLI